MNTESESGQGIHTLISLAVKMWIDVATGKVRWEDQIGGMHTWYVHPTSLILAAQVSGWNGHWNSRGTSYCWSPVVESLGQIAPTSPDKLYSPSLAQQGDSK